MCAQMKTLIDRTVPRYGGDFGQGVLLHRHRRRHRHGHDERTIEGLRGFTEDCLPGAVGKGHSLYGVGAWQQKGDIEKTPAMAQAYGWAETSDSPWQRRQKAPAEKAECRIA